MQHAAQPEQTQQHPLVEQEVGYHGVAPFHGGETGALYPFCRLRNYPHAGGTRPRFATSLISSRLNHPRSFQTGGVPSPYSARYIEYFCGLDNPESLGCHGSLTRGNSHTHDAVGADGAQRATWPTGPLSPQSHEWTVAREALCAPTQTHTAIQDRAAAVLAGAAVAALAAGVSCHGLA